MMTLNYFIAPAIQKKGYHEGKRNVLYAGLHLNGRKEEEFIKELKKMQTPEYSKYYSEEALKKIEFVLAGKEKEKTPIKEHGSGVYIIPIWPVILFGALAIIGFLLYRRQSKEQSGEDN